jgi:hypothetical protein
VWAKKISASATAMGCAACIATAATLPTMGTAAEQLAETASVKLTALTDIDAFSALGVSSLADIDAFSALGVSSLADIDAFSALGVSSLDEIDAFSAIPVFFGTDPETGEGTGVLNGGGIDALSGYDALSAIPPYIALAGGDITATGDLDSVSAVDTFFGDGPVGADGETPVGGVFTGGGIDALAPNADSGGGYAALSALPVFFGSNAPNTNFGPGVFTGGGLSALSNYDALSAIPAYLNLPPNEAPPLSPAASEETSALRTTSTAALPGGGTGTQSPPSFAPKVQVQPQVQPQVEELKPPVTTPDNSGAASQNITRTSQKFEPTKLGESPFLFGSGGQSVDNGIRGWGEGLKKLGIGGADAPSGGDADGAE